jgi:hypothetical protein
VVVNENGAVDENGDTVSDTGVQAPQSFARNLRLLVEYEGTDFVGWQMQNNGRSIQDAFEQAISRAQIPLRLPAAAPARRVGAGYVQEFQSADAAGTKYLLAAGDKIGVAYLIGGEILERYLALGGANGALGYPKSDAANGRQLFEGGALAGSPVRQVSGTILTKWAAQGYERGPAGMPAASSFSNHSAAGFCRMHSETSRTISPRLATRALLVAKRSSLAHSGWPHIVARRANWRSLPTAMMIGWSAASNGW